MDPLIGVINELHDAFANVNMNNQLNLPQIAVVGSQSCGKSSVLESIVGKDFLPRGSGIVTRCPLVLQLVQLPKSNEEEWGEFLHIPNKKFFDFNEINEEITNRTIQVAGPSSITDKPINLKIFSNQVLNLTLVDLPGLVMNAVGDQPKDIDKQIKEMVTRYVAPKNTIILAISPANTDLATSQSLRLAKQLDPEGVRTLGVLTKIDLMDRGTDCYDILTNKTLPLRHGFIGVVCRSQHDINEKKSMAAARAAEHEFFANSPIYYDIADVSGTEYLSKKLNSLLLKHIKSVIPDLKQHVDMLMEEADKELRDLSVFEHEDIEPLKQVLSLIKTFSDTLNVSIDGGKPGFSRRLLGGPRLEHIFEAKFSAHVRSLSAEKDLTDECIFVNVRNVSGTRASLFPSDEAIVALCEEQISRLEQPSMNCVALIFEQLNEIVDSCAAKVERFPLLKREIVRICQVMLEEFRKATLKEVRKLIDSERNFMNMKHPAMPQLFKNDITKMYEAHDAKKINGQQQQLQEQQQAQAEEEVMTDNDDQGTDSVVIRPASKDTIDPLSRKIFETQMYPAMENIIPIIRKAVNSYFAIVKENVCDRVPKAITLQMITNLREEVYARLIEELYSEEKATAILAEPPEITAQRKAAEDMMRSLTKAQSALNRVEEYTLQS